MTVCTYCKSGNVRQRFSQGASGRGAEWGRAAQLHSVLQGMGTHRQSRAGPKALIGADFSLLMDYALIPSFRDGQE